MSALSSRLEKNQALPDFGPGYGSVPSVPFPDRRYQYRAKVQPFTHGGYELTIKLTDVKRVSESLESAEYGFLRGPRLVSMSSDREADIIKATQRAKKTVRLKCKEMGADRLLTLTTRETLNIQELVLCWRSFVDMVERAIGGKFWYLAVPEPHPSNPDHLHLHVALNVRLNVNILRRCWHTVLANRARDARTCSAGTRVPGAVLRGKSSPGNVDIQYIKVRGKYQAMEKVARYISKYITKDCLQRFNKKRYWSTKGAGVLPDRKVWLKGESMTSAWDEMLELLGLASGGRASMQLLTYMQNRSRFFLASSGELVWFNYVPDEIDPDPPPF